MAISEYRVDTGTTISSTEYSLVNDSTTIATDTTDGVYQAFIDFDAMTAGDQYRVRVYEKVYGAGTQRKVFEGVVTGDQPMPFVTPSLVLMHGWDVTVQKLAGTDRSISWSIRQVA